MQVCLCTMITYHNRAVLAPITRANCALRPHYAIVCLIVRDHTPLGGNEAATVIGANRISCRPPGPLDGLAASMLAAGVSSAGQIV